MHVRIEEGGHGEEAVGVDDLGTVNVSLAGARQLGDAAVADDDVVGRVDLGTRVECARVPQDDGLRGPVRAAPVQAGDGAAHAGSPIGVGAGSSASGSRRPAFVRSPPARSS